MAVSSFGRVWRLIALMCLLPVSLCCGSADGGETDVPKPLLALLQRTPGDTAFALCGAKPDSPAPTVFIMAGSAESVVAEHGTLFTNAAADLTRDGCLYVTIDLPCHGADPVEGEPTELSGWAHRVSSGQDLFGPFTKRCSEVLDYLISEGYTNPDCVAAVGTSRGGLAALHFAAAERRVLAVAIVSPVTDPLALAEFEGVTTEQVRSITAESLVPMLAGRPVSITMGNDDARVNTDACIAFARALVATARRQHPDQPLVPVELIVGPAAGHTALDGAYPTAASFLRRYVGANH